MYVCLSFSLLLDQRDSAISCQFHCPGCFGCYDVVTLAAQRDLFRNHRCHWKTVASTPKNPQEHNSPEATYKSSFFGQNSHQIFFCSCIDGHPSGDFLWNKSLAAKSFPVRRVAAGFCS